MKLSRARSKVVPEWAEKIVDFARTVSSQSLRSKPWSRRLLDLIPTNHQSEGRNRKTRDRNYKRTIDESNSVELVHESRVQNSQFSTLYLLRAEQSIRKRWDCERTKASRKPNPLSLYFSRKSVILSSTLWTCQRSYQSVYIALLRPAATKPANLRSKNEVSVAWTVELAKKKNRQCSLAGRCGAAVRSFPPVVASAGLWCTSVAYQSLRRRQKKNYRLYCPCCHWQYYVILIGWNERH